MIGAFTGIGVGLVGAVLCLRSVGDVRRTLDDWRREFREAAAEDASAVVRAATVDELLADLERRLEADSSVPRAAARVAVVAGAAAAVVLGLGSGWAEGLAVVPGATFGALAALRFEKIRSKRTQAARIEADRLVEQEAGELLQVDVPRRRRRRSSHFRRR